MSFQRKDNVQSGSCFTTAFTKNFDMSFWWCHESAAIFLLHAAVKWRSRAKSCRSWELWICDKSLKSVAWRRQETNLFWLTACQRYWKYNIFIELLLLSSIPENENLSSPGAQKFLQSLWLLITWIQFSYFCFRK